MSIARLTEQDTTKSKLTEPKTAESKEIDFGEIMPDNILCNKTQDFSDVRKLICEYYYNPATMTGQKFLFWGIDPEAQRIANLIRLAAPFKEIEAYIRTNPSFLLKTFEIDGWRGTPVQLAIIGLDVTIRSEEKNSELDKGNDKRLLELHKELVEKKLL